MKPLQISRICEQFPPRPGGLSSGMLNLSMAQHKAGHSITVITRCYPGDSEFDSDLPFKVIRIPTKRLLGFGWKSYGKVKKLVVHTEIVQSHGPAAFSYLLRQKKDDPPFVHSIHSIRKYQYNLYKKTLQQLKQTGIPSHRKYSFISPFIQREYLLEKYICRWADHLTLVADYFPEQLREYYGISLDKMTVILNGSSFNDDLESLQSKDQHKKNGVSEKVILFVGRFDWHKRIDLLIYAMHRLLRNYPNAKLLLVGDGIMLNHLVQLTKSLNLSEKIIFTGWLNDNAIIDYYRKASCFCLPSLIEGLPKVLLEAMSMKIPVIAADNLGTRALLSHGKYGFLVKDQTPEAWADAITDVFEHSPVVNRKVILASGLLDKMYRWNHVAHRLDKAYEKVLK